MQNDIEDLKSLNSLNNQSRMATQKVKARKLIFPVDYQQENFHLNKIWSASPAHLDEISEN